MELALRVVLLTFLVAGVAPCAASEASGPETEADFTVTISEKGVEENSQRVFSLGPSASLRVVDESNRAIFLPQPTTAEQETAAQYSFAYVFENGHCNFERKVAFTDAFPGYSQPLWVRTATEGSMIKAPLERAVATYTFTNPPAEYLSKAISFCVRFTTSSAATTTTTTASPTTSATTTASQTTSATTTASPTTSATTTASQTTSATTTASQTTPAVTTPQAPAGPPGPSTDSSVSGSSSSGSGGSGGSALGTGNSGSSPPVQNGHVGNNKSGLPNADSSEEMPQRDRQESDRVPVENEEGGQDDDGTDVDPPETKARAPEHPPAQLQSGTQGAAGQSPTTGDQPAEGQITSEKPKTESPLSPSSMASPKEEAETAKPSEPTTYPSASVRTTGQPGAGGDSQNRLRRLSASEVKYLTVIVHSSAVIFVPGNLMLSAAFLSILTSLLVA
ncbi:Toxoplasma gondii family A protein [Toxoplasma gondii RUB]|uniref:Toxoplasma gondii family A protein n=1 Tax=Toxoplasma gondii RUB TaxID=935652 RepID=A0A086LU73_TOXGO|nr:Toxoplasma gondii family A protein [Toxoplasma gondii RUB]